MKPAVAVTLLIVAGCGDSGPPPPAVDRSSPPAVKYDAALAAGDVEPAGEPLVNPFAGDAEAAARGEALFSAMNCDGCHGGGGVGFVGPSLIDGRWRYGGDDTALFQSIFYGRPQGMPAYGGLLPDTTVWQLVSFVNSRPMPDFVPTAYWQ